MAGASEMNKIRKSWVALLTKAKGQRYQEETWKQLEAQAGNKDLLICMKAKGCFPHIKSMNLPFYPLSISSEKNTRIDWRKWVYKGITGWVHKSAGRTCSNHSDTFGNFLPESPARRRQSRRVSLSRLFVPQVGESFDQEWHQQCATAFFPLTFICIIFNWVLLCYCRDENNVRNGTTVSEKQQKTGNTRRSISQLPESTMHCWHN